MQVTTGDTVLAMGQRRVKKPLELLRALVAAGPNGATRDELCESVWELPLQVAYRPLVTTVFRLRRLLQDQQAILFTDRRVALNPVRCWVDSWAFETALQRPSQFSPETMAVLSLYHGALFEGQFAPYIGPARERCCRLFVDATLLAGRELVAANSLAAAQLHYEKALQYECRSEELFRALIEVLGRRGRSAAATIAYNTCEVAMRRYFGKQPSASTRAAWIEASGAFLSDQGAVVAASGMQPVVPAQSPDQAAQPAYA
jgi:DNA-binding SARP family transcriptional activator